MMFEKGDIVLYHNKQARNRQMYQKAKVVAVHYETNSFSIAFVNAQNRVVPGGPVKETVANRLRPWTTPNHKNLELRVTELERQMRRLLS